MGIQDQQESALCPRVRDSGQLTKFRVVLSTGLLGSMPSDNQLNESWVRDSMPKVDPSATSIRVVLAFHVTKLCLQIPEENAVEPLLLLASPRDLLAQRIDDIPCLQEVLNPNFSYHGAELR